MPHIHWVARQNKLEIPNDEEEVNTREIHKLIEEAPQCGSFFLVLKLTNNSKQICCTALIIQKEFFTTPFRIPTSQCGFAAGRRRAVAATESRRPGFICSCSCRVPHLEDKY
jgi:hypothetical protein